MKTTSFVISHIENGHYDPDTMSTNSRDAVIEFLRKNPKYIEPALIALQKDGYDLITVKIEPVVTPHSS